MTKRLCRMMLVLLGLIVACPSICAAKVAKFGVASWGFSQGWEASSNGKCSNLYTRW